MKICTKCKKQKNDRSFSFSNKAKNLRRSDCKDCYRRQKNLHYLQNIETERARLKVVNRKRKEKIDKFIDSYLENNPCVDCGISDIEVLTFDHLRDKKSNISRLRSNKAKLIDIEKEIKKCAVRCQNCHLLVTRQRAGSTRKQGIKRYSDAAFSNTLSSTRTRHHKTKKENFENMLSFLSDKCCKNCQNSDPDVLTFHHRDQSIKISEVSAMSKAPYKWNIVLKEINKCDILCNNCHTKLHRE